MKQLIAYTYYNDKLRTKYQRPTQFKVDKRIWDCMKKHYSNAFNFSLPKLSSTQLKHKFDDLKPDALHFCAGVILAFKNPSIIDLTLVKCLYTSTGVTKKSLNKLIHDASEGRLVLSDSCNTCTDMERRMHNLLDTEATSITPSWYMSQLGFKTSQQYSALISFLCDRLNKSAAIVENLLCKAYRTMKPNDVFWKDDFVYCFRNGKVIKKTLKVAKKIL